MQLFEFSYFFILDVFASISKLQMENCLKSTPVVTSIFTLQCFCLVFYLFCFVIFRCDCFDLMNLKVLTNLDVMKENLLKNSSICFTFLIHCDTWEKCVWFTVVKLAARYTTFILCSPRSRAIFYRDHASWASTTATIWTIERQVFLINMIMQRFSSSDTLRN
jgi:hypothetical protein